MLRHFALNCVVFIACLSLPCGAGAAEPIDPAWPKRVLITNDNGIDDTKTKQLARAFGAIAETYVAAPLQDRSGTTHSVTGDRKFQVERREFGEGVIAYAIDGTPAESVIFGLEGLLRDNPPDLVISGINGGENTGVEWIFSGTIGAARMAAVMGIRAIAVSGLSRRQPQNSPVLINWLIALVRSPIVREMKPGQYLTVSVPRVPFGEIKGVDLVARPSIPLGVNAKPFKDSLKPSERASWEFESYAYKEKVPAESDLASYAANRIAVVLMRADENDVAAMSELQERKIELPPWPVK